MLTTKTYSISELRTMLGSTRKQDIDRKLERYGIAFSVAGRGSSAVYTIEHISDPFKVYAIINLNIPAQSDFTKIRTLYYLHFCGDGFTESPLIEMERIMEAEGVPMARQTISKWLSHLERLNYITQSADQIRYYVIYKNKAGHKEYREVDADTYKKGWRIYFQYRPLEGSRAAYSRMYNTIGGHPYKKPVIIENAICQDEINQLIEVINESILADTTS